MRTVDIFYKSYHKDYKWLYYSLQSLTLNVTGYNNVIILIPESEKELFDTRNLPERTLVHYVEEYGRGYMFQQWCKINAPKYSYAEFIMFADSDCIFDHKIDLQEFVKTNKPEILYTDWSKVGDAMCWKQPTEDLMGEVVEWEFMRRNCLIYHRSTLLNLNQWKPDIEQIIMASDRFSEFNLIGAYAFKKERDKYTFVNTDNWEFTQPKAEQLWSHADKNGDKLQMKEYIRFLETLLKAFGINTP